MEVEYTARQTVLTAKLKQMAAVGLGRLEKIVDRAATAHIILTEDKYRKIAEVAVRTMHGDLVATCESTDMETALRDALQKVEKQALREKERFHTVTRQEKPMFAAL